MAGSDQDKNDGLISWVVIGIIAAVTFTGMIWLVGSHYVVYYGTPVLNALAFPWRIVPGEMSGSTVPDLNMTYDLFRRYPNRIGFGDWISYVNLALKRSEEHTSELKSLMRISYAAFCWKKKHQH